MNNKAVAVLVLAVLAVTVTGAVIFIDDDPNQELRAAAPSATTTTTEMEDTVTAEEVSDTTTTEAPSTTTTSTARTTTSAPSTTSTTAAPTTTTTAPTDPAEPVAPRDEGPGEYRPAPPPDGVRVSLEMTTTETASGGDLTGVYTLENTTAKPIRTTWRDGCGTAWGLYKNGYPVSSNGTICTSAETERTIAAGEVKRIELTFRTFDNKGTPTRRSEPLPPGEYSAAAGFLGCYDGDGDGDIDEADPCGAWFAAPVRVTIRG